MNVEDSDIIKLFGTGVEDKDWIREQWLLSFLETSKGTEVKLFKPKSGEIPENKFKKYVSDLCTTHMEEEMNKQKTNKFGKHDMERLEEKIAKRYGSNIKKLSAVLNIPSKNTAILCSLKDSGVDFEIRFVTMNGVENEKIKQGLVAMFLKGIKMRTMKADDWKQMIKLSKNAGHQPLLKEIMQVKAKVREEADLQAKNTLREALDPVASEYELGFLIKQKVGDFKRRLSSPADETTTTENDVNLQRQNSETESHNGVEEVPPTPDSPEQKQPKVSGWKSFTNNWKMRRSSSGSKGQSVDETVTEEVITLEPQPEVENAVPRSLTNAQAPVRYTSTMQGVVAGGQMVEVRIPEEPTPAS